MIKKSLCMGICLLFVCVLILGGCGSVSTSYRYYYPDWTPDGKIVCIKNKVDSTTGTGIIGGGGGSESNTYYIAVMDEDGTSEQEIKTISQVGKVAASPLGNYYAYSQGNYIKIITSSGTEFSSINCGAEVYSFDWSPDENKLVCAVFSENITREVFVISSDGTNKNLISTTGSSVSWRHGGKIVMNNPISTYTIRITAINANDYSEFSTYPKVEGGNYNVSKINTDEVVFLGNGIDSFYLSSPEVAPITLIQSVQTRDIKLSPDGDKIIGTGNGAGTDLGKEIWIINIDGTGLTQIK